MSGLISAVFQQDGAQAVEHRREIVRPQDALSPLRVPAEVLVISHEEAAQPELTGPAVRDALDKGLVVYESA